ncbi:MAG: DUF1343 domain-containing protein [Puniceicoccaceae bacterium]
MTSSLCRPVCTVFCRTLIVLWAVSLISLPQSAHAAERGSRISLGIDHLADRNFRPLWGKRVGLLSNPAGVNRFGRSTIDILRAQNEFQLVALFGPEHGIYGDEKANQPIEDRIDARTGLPVYSLYGKYRKPTPEMLANIDTLVIDLQDVGVRSYTYVSSMRLAIQACFEQGKEVVVLDRPNPLGGQKVDGPMLDKRFESYVGAFPVPYVHGLTIGELARMLKEVPGWLGVEEDVRLRGRLVIVPMKGWRRSMLWSDTGLDWVPTSPAIPDLSAAFGYSMTGLGAQLGNFRHGYGTQTPFRLLTYEGRAPHQIQAALENRAIPGLAFKTIRFRKPDGSTGTGVYVIIENWEILRPTEISFWMMQLAATWGPENPFRSAPGPKALLFNKHVGSESWWQQLISEGARVDVRRFVEENTRRAKEFQQWSRTYQMYR